MIEITQGESAVLQLTATVDEDETPHDLTGASFSSTVLGPNGKLVTFGNSKHAIVVAASGTFTLTLDTADTALIDTGVEKELVVTVTQGSNVKVFRDLLLKVLPARPQA